MMEGLQAVSIKLFRHQHFITRYFMELHYLYFKGERSYAHETILVNSPGFTSQSSVGNGRDQLTPSPNLRTSPLSQGSRNEVSPAGSLSEGLNNDR